MSDPDLIRLSSETALVEALTVEELQKMQANGPRWESARGHFERLKASMKAKDLTAAATALNDLAAAFDGETEDAACRARLAELIDLRRRVVGGEVKRIRAMSQILTADQALALVAAMSSAVQRNVKDRATLAAISAAFATLARGADGGGLPAARPSRQRQRHYHGAGL